MSGTSSYQDEWKTLFDGVDYVSILRSMGCKGHLRSSRFRSISWKIYLECLPEERPEWIPKTWEMRKKYRQMQEKLATNPRSDTNDLDLNLNNPLSQEDKSPWNKYFQDSELQITIKQDVIRTFPEIEFFQTPNVQAMMVRILFCYARQFPDISYRQGMHELLAPLLYVLHSDQQALLHASELDSIRQEIKELLDPEFTEPDAFFLFCQLMENVEMWYISNDRRHNKMEHLKLAPFSRPPETSPNSAIEVKLTKIHEQLLKRHDSEVFYCLKDLDIGPPVYGIRWLRLLFGREFCIQDLLVIWDAIFSASLSFDLVDYVFVAMLISIRDLLMAGDYTACLGYLMRYPGVNDIRCIIDLALHLKDPLHWQKPINRGQLLPAAPLKRNIRCNDRPKTLMINETFLPEPRNTVETSILNLKTPSPAIAATAESFVQVNEKPVTTNQTEKTTKSQIRKNSHSRHWSANWEHLVGSTNGSPGDIRKMKKEELLKGTSLSQSLSRLDSGYKEMVPMSTPTWHTDRNVKEGHDIMAGSPSTQMTKLRSMNDYCWRRMTLHLDRLQDGLLKQKLQNEDELLLAVAGLKRVRDILKGTLTFSEEVIDDENKENGVACCEDDTPWQILDASDVNEEANETIASVEQHHSPREGSVKRRGPIKELPSHSVSNSQPISFQYKKT